MLEERVGSSTSADKQFLYHPHYVDAVAMRRDSAGDHHYYLHDANFNVTAVVDDSRNVVERYNYTPYGEVTILNGVSDGDGAGWTVDANGSDIDNELLYTGRRTDPETGLQLNRNRFYHQQLGRRASRDPIGYLENEFNQYGYVRDAPTLGVDPSGFCRLIPGTDHLFQECDGAGGLTGKCFRVVNGQKVYVRCPDGPARDCEVAVEACQSKFDSCWTAATVSYLACVKLSGGVGFLPCTLAYLAWTNDCHNNAVHCLEDAMEDECGCE